VPIPSPFSGSITYTLLQVFQICQQHVSDHFVGTVLMSLKKGRPQSVKTPMLLIIGQPASPVVIVIGIWTPCGIFEQMLPPSPESFSVDARLELEKEKYLFGP
jgi:hypothetical protein